MSDTVYQSILARNAAIMLIIKDALLPDHLDAETLFMEACEYVNSYNCSPEIAVRDIIDAYREGEADAADAMQHGDWDYARE